MRTVPSCTRALAIVFAAALMVGSCNQRRPLPDNGVSIAPSPAPPPLPIAMYALSLNPPGLFGTAPSSGTVILTRPASEGNVTVTLSTGDPSIVTLPASVVVPEGADRATFPIATRTVPDDRQVPVAASTAGTSATAALSVWAVLPTFFSWVSDPGDPWKGGFGRLTAANATFQVEGGDTLVRLRVNGSGSDAWFLEFSAPRNAHLQLGTYDNVAGSSPTADRPGMSISGRGVACSATGGRFEIRELGFTPNPPFIAPIVSHFDATFEQRCRDASGAFRGEVRFTAGAR